MEAVDLKFSGHESFHCRPFWLKKGFDFIANNNSFSEKSGIDLGVGRNMVGSIRFWLRAFNLIEKDNSLTVLAQKLFNDVDGWDPFLEDEATLWLLHYELTSRQYSSTYNLIFSDLRKIRPEFTKNHFLARIKELDSKQTDNIVSKDFSVFTRTYFAKKSKDKEESFSGLFTELGLLAEVGKDSESNDLYHISNSKQSTIPWQVVLFCILDNPEYGMSISFNSLFSGSRGVGNLLAFNQETLEEKLIEISENLEGIVYKNDAGVKELQFKNEKPIGIHVLNSYYNEE
jgi:hypothetical protein